MAKSDEHSAPDRGDRVRDSPGETLPCTQMAPRACKIRFECNVLQVPNQIIPLGSINTGKSFPSVADQNCNGMSPDHPPG